MCLQLYLQQSQPAAKLQKQGTALATSIINTRAADNKSAQCPCICLSLELQISFGFLKFSTSREKRHSFEGRNIALGPFSKPFTPDYRESFLSFSQLVFTCWAQTERQIGKKWTITWVTISAQGTGIRVCFHLVDIEKVLHSSKISMTSTGRG